jgi:hypothetical protein
MDMDKDKVKDTHRQTNIQRHFFRQLNKQVNSFHEVSLCIMSHYVALTPASIPYFNCVLRFQSVLLLHVSEFQVW